MGFIEESLEYAKKNVPQSKDVKTAKPTSSSFIDESLNYVKNGVVPVKVETPKPKTLGQKIVGAGKAVANFLTSAEQGFGKTLGAAAATVDPTVNRLREESINQAKRQSDNYLKLAQQQTDKIKKQKYLQAAQKSAGDYFDIYSEPEFQKTAKQIYGEAAGVALDIVTAGTFGKAASKLTTGVLGKAMPTVVKGLEKQGIKATTKELAKDALTVGAPIGAGYGVSGAMQENKTLPEIAKSGVAGAAVGAGGQALIGAAARGLGKVFGKKAGEVGTEAAKEAQIPPVNSKIAPTEAIMPKEVKLPIKTGEIATKAISKAEEPLKYQSTIGKSGLAQSIKKKAIRDKIIYGFDEQLRDLPDYDKRIKTEDKIKATDFVLNDTDNAIKAVITGKGFPKDILPEDVLVALDKYATETNDVDLIRRLATQSPLLDEATVMGQRIQALSQLNENSPSFIVRKAEKELSQRVEKKTGLKISEMERETDRAIKAKIPKTNKQSIIDLITSLEC